MFQKLVGPVPGSKPLIFVLAGEKRLPHEVYAAIEQNYRPIEYKGEAFTFNCTDYYKREFGDILYRHIICFKNLMDPAGLVQLKWDFYHLEQKFCENDKRKFNLDPGYLDTDKLVLGSFKRGKYKLYLGDDVYGDMLLEYAKGRFSPMKWAFSDFQDGRYHSDLLVVREKLKADLGKIEVRSGK